MKKRYPGLTLGAIVTTFAIIFSSCTKINESTDLGGGLIPPVDNITTFDTTLTVQAFNDTFGIATDTLGLGPSDEYFLGKITNDQFFGRTDARLFLQLKPTSFPFVFLNKSDSLRIDSVVLILDYAETYGDTITAQTINVYEMDQSNTFRSDSTYRLRQNNFTYSNLLGTRTFPPTALRDSVKAFGGDTTNNQLRIKLNNSFGQRLLNYDSTSSLIKGAYASDSVFDSKFKGFALQSVSNGNAVMGFNLAGANTKLAIYYKYDKWDNNVPNVDTAVAYFNFGSFSASANYIIRDNAGTPALASLNNSPTTPDPVVYIQTTPGTFATIKIPGLGALSNRVVHRAELVMEEVYDISDSMFNAPAFLYLDAIDPTITTGTKFRTIPYDLTFLNSSDLNFSSFGVIPVFSTDGAGNKIKTWHFNLSRYVQHILTHTQSVYDLRLFAPVFLVEKFGIPPGADIDQSISVNTSFVKGRVRLAGNTGPLDTNPRRMRLRIIYSKL